MATTEKIGSMIRVIPSPTEMVVEIEHPKRRGVKWRQGIVRVGENGDVYTSTVIRKNPHRVTECVLVQIYDKGRLIDLKHVDMELLSTSDDAVIDHRTRRAKMSDQEKRISTLSKTLHRQVMAERAGRRGFRGPRRAGGKNRPIRMWRGGVTTLVGEFIDWEGFTLDQPKGKGERYCPQCDARIGSQNRVCPECEKRGYKHNEILW